MDDVERFRARYPFALDDFQLEAVRAIASDQSVIVSAPTGAEREIPPAVSRAAQGSREFRALIFATRS